MARVVKNNDPEQRWTVNDARRFIASNRADLCACEISFLHGGYWNDVLKITTACAAYVLKRYRTVLSDSLFPNLPNEEARALRQLTGTQVAPEFVGYWPEAKILLYSYVEGRPWSGDPAPIAKLLGRKERVDCAGFRCVPTDIAGILAQGDGLFDRCEADDAVKAFRNSRPDLVRLAPPERLSLIHTDIGAGNLIGNGDAFRLIDWQCPAAGDLAEDVYTFLSPAFQILNHRQPLDDVGAARFLDALEMPAIVERYRALRPAFAYRMGAYCCLRYQTAPPSEKDLVERYVDAARAELAAMTAR